MKDYIGAAQANLGWALLKQGKLVEAEALLEEALETLRARRAYVSSE